MSEDVPASFYKNIKVLRSRISFCETSTNYCKYTFARTFLGLGHTLRSTLVSMFQYHFVHSSRVNGPTHFNETF